MTFTNFSIRQFEEKKQLNELKIKLLPFYLMSKYLISWKVAVTLMIPFYLMYLKPKQIKNISLTLRLKLTKKSKTKYNNLE